MSVSTSTVFGMVALTVVLALYVWLQRSARRFPPGPNPIPILGRLHAPINQLAELKQWADQYPEIMTVTVWSRKIIVLNTHAAVAEILEKRSATTSGRPKLVMAHELVGHGDSPSQTSDASLHKKYRRLFASGFAPRTVLSYAPFQVRQMRKAALAMLASPQGSVAALSKAVSSVSLMVTYGYDLEKEDDAFVNRVKGFLPILERLLTPGAFVVDLVPFLKHLPAWLPGMSFKHLAAEWRQILKDIREIPFARVKRDIGMGKAKPSFCASLIEEQVLLPEQARYDEDLLIKTAGGIYAASADTTSSALRTLLAALVLFPSVQQKAQSELDRIVGRERLPTLEDRDQLHYCKAVVHEVLRWHPVTPFATPHVMEKDEEFRGYVLPKGTTVVPNVWAMTREEHIYPSPDVFLPERFLTADGKQFCIPDMARNIPLTFGFGRRICPGSHLAEGTIFAAVISVLWSCTISRPPGTENMEIEFLTPGVHHPKPFPPNVTPRFSGAVELLQNAMSD
ncbi:cytochrome P450 [Dacryopinax primogenitus]|uniref:Cytochrome P450 n=1 Tax=Dacryopinax primogenitus (strain DJM 731) TaxID=1858805 RepID=M5FQ41_DACPD|nr:cytochrome P450 [Dacryopinax primogenitus]EJT98960.1 cytochrome P450 [Dacryopinax primogenitus]